MEIRGEFTKLDEDQRLAFGWASVVVKKDGDTVTDAHDDTLDLGSLEGAVYDYVLMSRDADVMHQKRGVASLVESVFFTPEKIAKMGLPADSIPVGWWVGFKVLDADVWKRVKDGTLKMFSIAGRGTRHEGGTDA